MDGGGADGGGVDSGGAEGGGVDSGGADRWLAWWFTVACMHRRALGRYCGGLLTVLQPYDLYSVDSGQLSSGLAGQSAIRGDRRGAMGHYGELLDSSRVGGQPIPKMA